MIRGINRQFIDVSRFQTITHIDPFLATVCTFINTGAPRIGIKNIGISRVNDKSLNRAAIKPKGVIRVSLMNKNGEI